VSCTALTGFILHRRPYRETSFLLDIFSLEWGLISAVGKGIRGSKSDKKSLLQPFQALLLGISGRHELKNLQQVDALGASYKLEGHFLFSAMYINELLNRLVAKEIPQPELFNLYQTTLDALAQKEAIEPQLRQFELSLLADLGYGIDFLYDSNTGQTIDPQAHYSFIHEQGWLRLKQVNGGVNCFTGTSIMQINSLTWTSDSLLCAKYISRLTLAKLLGDKPLKSRELFKQSWSKASPLIEENVINE
jgi:DNA repair protein RecO (recombination protein O)